MLMSIKELLLENAGGSIGLVTACGDKGRRFESRWRRYEASCKGIEPGLPMSFKDLSLKKSRIKVGANLATLTRSTLFLLEAEEKWWFSELSATTGLLNSINTVHS